MLREREDRDRGRSKRKESREEGGRGVVLHKAQQDDKFTLILLNSSCGVMADDVLPY